MKETIKIIFDNLFEYVEKDILSDNFENACDKIGTLARSLWFDYDLLSIDDVSTIDQRIFDLRSKRMNLELKSKIEKMNRKFKTRSEKVDPEFELRSEKMEFDKIITELLSSSIQ